MARIFTKDSTLRASPGYRASLGCLRRQTQSKRKKRYLMDPISTALSVAWLDALRRAQSDMVQRLQDIAPQTKPGYSERTLTDVIESGLKHGGTAPPTEATGPAPDKQRVDILV